MTYPKRLPRYGKSLKSQAIYAGLAWLGVSLLPLHAATFQWQGAGAGPSSGNEWETPGNWHVTGTPDGALPGINDAVEVLLSVSSASDYAVIISEGATGGNVRFSGGNNTDNRQVLVGGNATFDSLSVEFSAGAQQQSIFDLNGKKITITGGSSAIPSLKTGVFTAARVPFAGTGEIEFTSSNVYLSIGARNPYNLRFTTAGAAIDFLNVAPHLEGSLGVRSDQTLSNVTSVFLEGASLISLDNQRLDNFSGVFLESHRPGTGKDRTSRIAAGTYGGLLIDNDVNGLSYHSFTLDGDTSLDSKKNVGGTDHTVVVDRRFRNDAVADLTINGYTLTTTASGDGTVRIGSLEPDSSRALNWLDMKSGEGGHSTVNIEGDFIVGYNGYILAPDAADIVLKGNFESRSVKNTLFDATGLTLRMEGEGTAGDPQFLEVMGEDLGAGATFSDNFAIGNLIIGSEGGSTYVTLTDQFQFSSNGDALYVGSLWIHEGSTLALNGFNLYVGGVLVAPGDTQYGPGVVVIPEPGTAAMLGVIGGLVVLTRCRRSGFRV